MTLPACLDVDDADRERFEDLYSRYRSLYEAPEACQPMIIVDVPVEGLPSWEERLADPLVMLSAELATLRPHLEIRDDRVPTVRVQFGTAQVAAAFGCRMYVPENNLPAAAGRVLEHAEDVYGLDMPSLDAGWYSRLAEWTERWLEHLPEGVYIQHPDIQSAFNSAHLIRGNDILLDLYEHPDAVGVLLDLVTDFMVAITRRTKAPISNDPDWFFDWGGLWKGFARISNCSMQMISPELYRDHVLPRDARFFESVGGGRIHYCGITRKVIDEFFKIPSVTGLDIDCSRHDFYAVCRRAPNHVALVGAFGRDSVELARMAAGDWPEKRNIIVVTAAASVAEGRQLLSRLRDAVPY